MPRPYRLNGRSRRLQAAIKRFGSEAQLAKRLTPATSRQAVNTWRDIPPARVKQIERLMQQ